MLHNAGDHSDLHKSSTLLDVVCIDNTQLYTTIRTNQSTICSACHAGKKDWESSASDAKECIKINPSFIKGYYRLANAQSEQNEFDAALATIKQGLGIESDNPQLQKQLRQVKARKASLKRAESSKSEGGRTSDGMPYRNLDASTNKEVMDLQQQLQTTTKEYRMVRVNIQRAQKDKKANEITKSELEKLPQGTDAKMYRAVGKMFMLTSRSDIMSHLDESIEKEGKVESDLGGKLDYLERRMKSQQQNIQELTKSATAE